MRVTVEVTPGDVSEMAVSKDQLEEAVRNELGSLDVEGDALYINDLDVVVVVADGPEGRMQAAFEAKYQRDWNDPAGDEMKAVWADAWAAAKLCA